MRFSGLFGNLSNRPFFNDSLHVLIVWPFLFSYMFDNVNIAFSYYCAPGHGVLATLCIMRHIVSGSEAERQISITHYLDNESVIARIKQNHESCYETATQKLLPEHDVIEEITRLLRLLPITVKFKWIKGHQDIKKKYDDLPLPAQLNCDADKEATIAMQNNTDHPKIVPPLPSTPCQIIIQDESVTNQIKRRVHEAMQAPKLQAYTCQKFNWTVETHDKIDWENFRTTLAKYRERWSTMVKHIHHISPTGHIAHRNNSLLPHECPACSQEQEDNNHVLQCRHPSRALWRSTTIQKVRAHLVNATDPVMTDILHDGLLRFHNMLPAITPDSYPQRYQELITSQNAIGFGQLYKGRWSQEWKRLQNLHNTQHPTTSSHITGKEWLLSVSRLLLDQWLLLWKLRNEQRHGKDDEQRQASRKETITSTLRHLYTYREKVCPVDRHIFYQNYEEHLLHHTSLDAIEDWINCYTEAIKASADQATQHGIAQNRAIDEYPTFNPILQPGPTA